MLSRCFLYCNDKSEFFSAITEIVGMDLKIQGVILLVHLSSKNHVSLRR